MEMLTWMAEVYFDPWPRVRALSFYAVAVWTLHPVLSRPPLPLPGWVNRLAHRFWTRTEEMTEGEVRVDWLVFALLALAAAVRLGDESRPSGCSSSAPCTSFGVLYLAAWQELRATSRAGVGLTAEPREAKNGVATE